MIKSQLLDNAGFKKQNERLKRAVKTARFVFCKQKFILPLKHRGGEVSVAGVGEEGDYGFACVFGAAG